MKAIKKELNWLKNEILSDDGVVVSLCVSLLMLLVFGIIEYRTGGIAAVEKMVVSVANLTLLYVFLLMTFRLIEEVIKDIKQ